MRIEKCSICAHPVYPGHGMTFVRNDAKIFRYCSRKCRMKFDRKSNPRKLKWTKAYRRAHKKELTMDTTFDFEQQRNRPPKYDRELYAQTIRAIQRISAVQLQRQRDFYYKRMKQSLINKKSLVKRETKKNIDLVLAPVAQKRRQALMAQEMDVERDTKHNQRNLVQNAATRFLAKKRQQQKQTKITVEDDDSDSDNEMMMV